MYLLKPLTEKCRTVFETEVPPEMMRGQDLMIEFKLLHETIAALKQAGLEMERDYWIE